MMTTNCQHCGEKLLVGRLQCPKCKKWQGSDDTKAILKHNAVRLSEVVSNDTNRIKTGPWDFIFGTNWKTGESGIAQGSVNLIGGLRGCGKSTLFLQIADAVVKQYDKDVLFISSEEPNEQIKARGERLGLETMYNIVMVSLLTGEASDLEEILSYYKPVLFMLDSVSALAGENMAASVAFCKAIKKFSMNHMIPALITSHVNKSGDIGGLETVQHEVDSVITFFPEGDTEEAPRILHVEKNRNGKAYIDMALGMTAHGLIPYEAMEILNDENDDETEE